MMERFVCLFIGSLYQSIPFGNCAIFNLRGPMCLILFSPWQHTKTKGNEVDEVETSVLPPDSPISMAPLWIQICGFFHLIPLRWSIGLVIRHKKSRAFV